MAMANQTVAAYGGKGPMLNAVGWTFASVATILVALRIYTRLRIVRKGGGWALFWAIFAWALAFVDACFMTFVISHGFGNRGAIVEETGNSTTAILWTWITAALFNTAVAVGKVAAVSFLLSMQGDTYTKKRWFLWMIAISNAMLGFANSLTNLIQCTPPAALWDQSIQGVCRGEGNFYYTYFVGAWCAASDMALALYPVFLIWPLQTLQKRLKLIVCFLMSLSVFSSVCAVLRTYEVRTIKAEDPTYALGTLFVYGAVEMWMVIIVSCIPPLYPCFKRWKHSATHRSSQTPSQRWFGEDGGSQPLRNQSTNRRSAPSYQEPKNGSFVGTASMEDGSMTPKEVESPSRTERPATNLDWVRLE